MNPREGCAGPPRCYAIGPGPLAGADAWVAPAHVIGAPAAMPKILLLHPAGVSGFEDDVVLSREPGISALMLPAARDIRDVCAVVELCPHELLVVIDNAQGLDQVRAIALVPGVARLVFDASALMARLGIDGEEGLLAFRAQVVLASHLAGLPAPVDASALPADRARRLGFGACLCRDAGHIEAARAAFPDLPAGHDTP